MKTRQNFKYTQSGLTLVELMIAMAIGLVLVGGALFVYTSARAAFTTNESYALMQENARYALSVLEPDVQLAGYWGQHRDATEIAGSAKRLELSGSTLSGIADDCADNWIVQFDRHIEGYNDVLSTFDDLACIKNTIAVGSDVFAVRRVDGAPVNVLNAGQYYMRSSEKPISEVFLGDNAPTSLPDSAANYELIANAYYIRPGTEGQTVTQPALRRVSLESVADSPTMVDNEITTGIEDMQIQYGIGPPDVLGARSGVSTYVSDIENLVAPNNTVRSMKIWLLMRAERPELGYVDDKEYRLGDKIIAPSGDSFRRLVVSKTVFFRNLH